MKDKAAPTDPEPTIPLGQLKEAVLNSPGTDYLFGKASQAAAFAVRDMFAYGEKLRVPANTQEWIKVYTDHLWAYAGTFALAATIAPLRPTLVEVDMVTNEEKEVPGHPAVRLLRRPNDSMTGLEMMEALVIYLETCGMGYLEVVYEERERSVGKQVVDTTERPSELWLVRPDRLTPEPRKDGRGVQRWVFQTKKGAKKEYFGPDEIIPLRYFHPLNDWFGLGSLQPAIDDVRQDQQMAKWNLDFFEHGITPEGLLYTDKPITPYEMRSLGKQIKAFLAGKGRQVLILGKNLKWQTVSLNPKDVEFLEGRRENRQAILAALGVPPVMVGLLEHAKYDNYALQVEAFHRDSVVPKVRRIEACLENFYIPKWPKLKASDEKEHRISFDKSALIQENEDRLTDRLVVQIGHGLRTPNEARIRLGLEEYEGGDGHYMMKSLVPMDEEETEAGLEEREDELVAQVQALEEETEKLRQVQRRKAATAEAEV